MRKIIFAFILSFINTFVNAQFDFSSVLPDVKGKQLKYTGFTVAFDTSICSPIYSIYILTREKIIHSVVNRKKFKFLNEHQVSCVSESDYTFSRYDRGHLTPFADSKYSEESMHDCFYITNMCPQLHKFNAGIWEVLEKTVRNIAESYDSIIVISAPVISSEQRKGKLMVPNRFYKILYSVKYNQGIAFVMDQSAKGNIFDYSYPIVSLDTIANLKYFQDYKMRNIIQKSFWIINYK